MTLQRERGSGTVGTAVLTAVACLVGALAGGPAAAQSFANIENWPNVGGANSGWQQPFDRSFSRQWEANPERGYPTLSMDNIGPTKAAIKRYAEIVARGGWKPLPNVEMRTGLTDPAVVLLRRRLEVTGDLRQDGGYAQTFDYYVEKAVQRAQRRHGLPPTGVVNKATLAALNVPASARLRQLRTNLVRLTALAKQAGKGRHVLVNVPAAQIEAVENNKVVSRHAGVVGRADRQTPLLSSKIHELNFNKDWIVPPTVIKEDLIPKGRQVDREGRNLLYRYGVDVYRDYNAYARGDKLDPTQINWSSREPYNLFYAQKAGEKNPLGFVKINFHNPHSVYMHDTPSQTLFSRAFRAESSGCVRVQNIQQLVAWLLEDNGGWDLRRVNDMKRSREPLNVQLVKPVPLFFAYVTAWATPDGAAQFRRDIYRKDGVGATASAY